MDMNELRNERYQGWHDTIRGNNPKRVPHYGNIWLIWQGHDAGFTISETLNNYDNAEKAIRHTAETYKLDLAVDTGWRNPLQVKGVLNSDEYIINDADYTMNIKDVCLMEPEDYDALIANPKKFLWETLIPRKWKRLRDSGNYPPFQQFLQKYGELGAFLGKMAQITTQEYGWCNLFPTDAAFDPFGHGLELLFNSLRGIKGLSYDIRRIPDKVEAAIEALNETFFYPRMERAKEKYGKGTLEDFCVDVYPVIFSHTIMSTKQFERFYWPYFEQLIKYVEEYDKIGFFYVEGDSTRFHDFYRQLPANRFAALFDQDDIVQAKKDLPNLAIAGGVRASLLSTATPDECIEEVKRVMDAVAYDKKFVFSEHTMISYPGDCKPENMKAICDYIDAYRY